MTAAGEIPSDSATSALVRPPKNLIATTLACRGSTFANSARASSTRMMSAGVGDADVGIVIEGGAPITE